MSLLSEQVTTLRYELQRVQTMLYDVRAQKNRLQYEMDTIHNKHGTYQIICHLRNEIQRLTISKLVLIQSTALEMDRLRKIIRLLSNGDKLLNGDIAVNQTQILTDLLPPPTPTSPPPNFSWKETFNIDLHEEEIDNDNRNHDSNNNNRLDTEDDIKIPEMNLDLEDGAMQPISLLQRESSSDIDSNDDDSNDDNESNDENGYVIERVASPEAGHNNYDNYGGDDEFEDNDSDNVQIAIAEKKSLFSDNYDILNRNSDDLTDEAEAEAAQHHIHDDNCNHSMHPPHDASPQLQFAGDGIDLNQIHGIATNTPILPPSTEDGDIYGEEDHKFVISIHDEKLDIVELEQVELDDTHALISPKISPEKDKKNKMENLELISEMGDDDDRDRERSPQQNTAKMKIAIQSPSPFHQPIIPITPDHYYNSNTPSDDTCTESDDFEYDSLMVHTPKSQLQKAHAYDISTEIFHNLSIDKPISPDKDNKPRKPIRPRDAPSSRQRSLSLSARNVPLLKGLRIGEMDVHIDICSMSELIDLLPVICRAMTLLPYGLMEFRNKLSYILQKRMCDSYELTQHFTFFLNSYRDCFAVSRLFKDHICMESIVELQRLNTFVVRPTGGHVKTPSNTKYIKNEKAMLFDIEENDEKDKKHNESGLNMMFSPTVQQNEQDENIIEYSGSNVVEFFRLPLVYPYINQTFNASQCTELVCPISGHKNVQRLEIRKVYKSNAKPLLVDCYLRDKFTPIASFILKYGDDLRRDASVLTMFKFMNDLWSDCGHKCIYNNKQIAALTYKCFPLGPDYGVIELIPNCQTLKDITDKYVQNNKRGQHRLSEDVMNNLIATCAGSFMAAYIMGIRDRHYDNLLVTAEGTIFHIDFGYMLGEKVSGIDTSKIAITHDLAKLMGKKWKEFVKISVECWVVLRENHQELLDFAKLAFSFLYPQETVQEFLKDSLLLHLSVEDGRNKINKRLLQAPKKLKTKLKNFVHSVAVKRERSPSAGKRERSHSSAKRDISPSPSPIAIKNERSSIFNKKDSSFFRGFLSPKKKAVTD